MNYPGPGGRIVDPNIIKAGLQTPKHGVPRNVLKMLLDNTRETDYYINQENFLFAEVIKGKTNAGRK
ncbi:MAG: hypothetical protein A2017_01315 [Lentisphaerae bacterium GWF2_44_16]|nr:MAG: hypothetical protein A2017_01315 [Lentisphaerae bacterium GWF2_44_16]